MHDVLALKLNTQGASTQLGRTPLPILNQSVDPCPVLTVASYPADRFLRRQVRWSGIPIFKNFPQFVVIHTVRVFRAVSEADVLPEFPCFLYESVDAGNLISDSSAFSKPSLFIWKLSVHKLLKPSLKDFEHNLTNM